MSNVLSCLERLCVRCWEYFKDLQVANSSRSSLRTRRLGVYVQLWMPCLLRPQNHRLTNSSGPHMPWTLDIMTWKLSGQMLPLDLD